jgi:hypothetical protein
VRAVGSTTDPTGQLIRDPTFRGRRQIQHIKCKYSTDGSTRTIIDHIYTIYEPLKQALQTHGTLRADINIILIVVRRTSTFNVKNFAETAHLVSFKEEPRDALTYKHLPKLAQKSPWPHTYTHKNGSPISQRSHGKYSPQETNNKPKPENT